MASTYVNNLRLNEMATGDASGTWGTVTNTNLELIGEALGFGTEAITTNADTHTTTVADGASDAGRAMYLKYTGTLDSACTITIAPNTMKRMQFIENGTSGSQNIIISQGSGANVTIPAGDVKAVYLDGAGSGAAVTDAFASLNVVDLKVEDDLTVTDDLIVNGDIDLEGSIDVNGTANLDVVDIDGAVDMASTLQVDGSITSSDGATITVNDNSIALSLISTDADANEGPGLVLYRNSSSPADNDANGQIYMQGENDADQKVTYSLIEGFIDDASDGTEDGILRFSSMVSGTSRNRMDIIPAATVFNEDSVDVDFRVESNGNANMLFVDGGTNRVGIGTNAPDSALHVDNSHTGTLVTFHQTAGASSDDRGLDVETSSTGTTVQRWLNSGSELMRMGGNGRLGVGVTDANTELEIGSAQPNIRLRDTDNNHYARIGGSAGDLILEADGGDGQSLSKMSFRVDNADRMELDANGSLELGHGGAAHQRADSQAFSIITPASGGGQGIALKRLDSNTDQGLGEITWSNNTQDGLGKIKGKTDGATNSFALTFEVANAGTVAEKVRIDKEGTLMAGATTKIANCRIFMYASPSIPGIETQNTTTGSTNYAALFRNNSGTQIGYINISNTGTEYNTGSDYRLKENVRPIENGLERLNNLNPVKFDWKEDGTSSEGFIAHEVQEVFPDAVSGEKDGKTMQGMDYGRITPLLVKAIQEQQEQIEQLKAEIKTLQ